MSSSRTQALIIVASLTLNVLLAGAVLRLKTRDDVQSAMRALAPGTRVGAFRAENGDGDVVTVRPSDASRNTIMYFYRDDCKWCDRNLPNVINLARSVGSNYRLVGIALSKRPTAGYEIPYPFPVFFSPEPKMIGDFRLQGTPQTMVVDSSGTVRYNWLGAYDGPVRAEMETALGIDLGSPERGGASTGR